MGDLHTISQCINYGSVGGHGWFGETYAGTIETGGVKYQGQVYTVMNSTVGLDGNQCGPILEGSIGIEENTTIRGVMGTGANDRYTYSDWIKAWTWTKRAKISGQCLSRECECPKSVVSSVQSTFLTTLDTYDVYQFAITWDGTLGKNTGTMLWNKDAEKALTSNNPKVPIETDPRESLRLWSTNVTRIAINGEMTNQTRRLYYFDTGSAYISLPDAIFDSIIAESVVTFYFLTMDDWAFGNTSELNMTVTQELKDAGIFRRASTDSFHIIGLNIFRYLDNLLINFNDTQPFFQTIVRKTPILDLPAELPVGQLATSESEETQELNVTGDINTGVMPPSATITIWNQGGTAISIAAIAATIFALISS